MYESLCATNIYRTQTPLHPLCILEVTFCLVLQLFVILPCILKLSQSVILSVAQAGLAVEAVSELHFRGSSELRALGTVDSALCYVTIFQSFLIVTNARPGL